MDPISTLAAFVDKKLTSAKQHSPGQEIIRELLHVVYMTSMKREESEQLKCGVVYLDPRTKHEAKSPGAETWNAFTLTNPVPLDPRNLAKLAQSADPSAILLAVFPDDKGKLLIWGFVDQVAVHSLRMATWETQRAEGAPGDFHVVVNGVADITVYRSLNILTAMKQDSLIERYDDVLNTGPVSLYVRGLSSRYIPLVSSRFNDLPKEYASDTLDAMLQAALLQNSIEYSEIQAWRCSVDYEKYHGQSEREARPCL